jgi:hypothetical protein
MELASMLTGDRFTDRPSSVCPVVGSILRKYNDVIDDRRRQDLYHYAAESVGTRRDLELRRRRAAVALAWAHEGHRARKRVRLTIVRPPTAPATDSRPDLIADYVVGSLPRRPSASAHAAMLWLLDRLTTMRPDGADRAGTSFTNIITGPQHPISADDAASEATTPVAVTAA